MRKPAQREPLHPQMWKPAQREPLRRAMKGRRCRRRQGIVSRVAVILDQFFQLVSIRVSVSGISRMMPIFSKSGPALA